MKNPPSGDLVSLVKRLDKLATEKKAVADTRQKLLSGLSPQQLAFVTDPAKRKLALTARQSGKTHCALTLLLDKAQSPNRNCAYIHPTRKGARDVIWERLKSRVKELGIKKVYFNESTLEARFSNGSIIYLKGSPNKITADYLRGLTLDILVIDEACVYPNSLFEYLLKSVVSATTRVRKADLILLSTPGPQPKGLFYDIWADPKSVYSKHHWLFEGNPAYENPEEEYRLVREEFNYAEDDPTYLREYRGQWVLDLNAQVYHVQQSNLYQHAPETDTTWHTVLGMDFGSNDETTVTVCGWRDHDDTVYVLYSDGEPGNDVTDAANHAKSMIDAYQPEHIVGDGGALGKMIIQELNNRHGLNIEATPKAPGYKPALIRQINASLKRNKIMMPNGRLFEQMQTLSWHPDKLGVLEKPGQKNDLCDSFAYAWMRCNAFMEAPAKHEPLPGTPEFFRLKLQRIAQQRRNSLQARDEFGGIVDDYDDFNS